MRPPIVNLDAFDWTTAAALLALGVLLGYTFWAQLWPLWSANGTRLTAEIAISEAAVAIFIPLFFISLLRWLQGLPLPAALSLELLAFRVGASVGLIVKERRRPWTP